MRGESTGWSGDSGAAGYPQGRQLAAREMWRRHGVTERELAVWQLAARGMSGEAIGRELCISRGTVRTHLQNLYGKLGVKSRGELVALAWSSKLVEELGEEST